jgi:hypothetical protein
METTKQKINKVTKSLNELLEIKNDRYGDSALNPMTVFTGHVSKENTTSVNLILTRLDDKLQRIKNSNVLRKNDVADLMGYCTLLCCSKDWTDFSDLID